MDKPTNIVILEDNPADAELIQRELRKVGINFTAEWAPDKGAFLQALDKFVPDLILADYSLPGFDGMTALVLAKQRFADIPVIIVSGAIGEEVAIETLKAGATDYVLKTRLGRLGSVVTRALVEAEQLAAKKSIEQALRESEERFRLLVDGVKDYAIFFLDQNGHIMTWNRGAEQMKGYTADEIMGRYFSCFYTPEDIARDKPSQELAKTIECGQFSEESKRVRKDGSVFWADVTITALYDEKGSLRGFAKMLRDITERKRTEAALAIERANLQAIFDVVNVGMLLIDEKGVVKRVNDVVARWIDKKPSAILNDQPGNALGCIHALEDSAGCGHTPFCHSCPIRNAFESAMRSGQPVHDIETPVTLSIAGKQVTLWLAVSADPVTIDGKRHIIIALNNITSRKQKEEELQKLNRTLKAFGKSSQAMIHATDESAYLKEVCRIIVEDCGHAMVWMGYAEDDEYKTVRPVAYSGFEKGYLETFKVSWGDTKLGQGPTGIAIRTGKASMCKNMLTDPKFDPVCREEAIKRGYASSIAIPLIAGGKTFGAINIYSKQPDPFSKDEVLLLTELAYDLAYGITTLRMRIANAKSQEELKKTAQELARSNHDLEQFAFIASHDLQEPLRNVKFFVQWLADKYKGKFDAKADEFIQFAVDGSTRMQQLIDGLLEYSRVGRGEPKMEPIDCNLIVQGALADLKFAIEDSSAQITCDPLPTVNADQLLLTHVFQNLIANAIKFHSDVTPKIKLSASLVDGYWRFSVSDNGIGIDRTQYERIFKIFQRLHSREKYPGTGIGLAVCKKIVELHGGRIWLESELGKGTTFYFTIPARNE